MTIGCFGKLPQRADFVASGLPESFLAPMDHWLRQGLQGGREHFGPDWTGRFAALPSWSFALSCGACGPDAMVGVMTPSRDRAGREFPFLVARAGPSQVGAAALAAASSGWLDWAGRAAREAVAGRLALAELNDVLGRGPSPAWPAMAALRRHDDGWSLDGGGELATALPRLLDEVTRLRRSSLWWSARGCLLVEGLPTPSPVLL